MLCNQEFLEKAAIEEDSLIIFFNATPLMQTCERTSFQLHQTAVCYPILNLHSYVGLLRNNGLANARLL